MKQNIWKDNQGGAMVLLVLAVGLLFMVGVGYFSYYSVIEAPVGETTTVEEPGLQWAEASGTVELEEEPEPEPEPEPEEEILPIEFNILGAGDNLIHSSIFLSAGQRAEAGDYDFTFAYENASTAIMEADIASINQETMLARSYAPAGYPRFNTPVQMAGQLADMGFDVVCVSNNHMYDVGEQGLRETLELLNWDYDFAVVGAYLNEEAYLDIPVITVEGVDVAFVATTQLTNGLSIPSSSELVGSVTPNESSFDEFLAQIGRATEVSDLVVANIHWGTEYTHEPSSFQRNLAQQAIEAGVDIIFGHHPHVLQPIEFITRSDGSQGVVCYSLGNFISSQDYAVRMIGGMMDVTIEAVGEVVSIKEVTFLPVITHYNGYYKNVQTYSYENYTPELAALHGVSALTFPYIYNTVVAVIDEQFIPADFHAMYG